MKLAGRTALVTGAARGIGEAIAAGLADAGATVILADIDGAGAEQAARRIGKGASGVTLDVTDGAACADLAAALGNVSILVNNAGIIRQGRVTDDNAPDIWARTLAINAGGAFNTARAFYTQLRDSKGAVINLASIRSFTAAGNAAAYAASKGAVLQLTKALAVEWATDGIRVNAIAPGFIETPLIPEEEKTPQREAMILSRTPMKLIGDPRDVAGAAAFLASDEARYITGATLPVDGGYLAG